MISKLQGVSGKQLQDAVKAVANVNALCAQTEKLTTEVNALGSSLDGAGLGGTALGTLVGTLELVVPAVAGLPLPQAPCS